MVVPLANFIGRKIETIRGKPTTACPQTGADLVAPLAAPCLDTVQTGGTRTVKSSATSKAVEITLVPAAHDSSPPIALLGDAARKNLEPDSLSLSLGPPGRYVLRFTNGLTAYLSGDTGIHAEMQTVERDFYKVNLMELNYGSSALTTEGAAYVVNTLVQPASVIVSHVNEAATKDGKVLPASRTAAFIALIKGHPVYPAPSGKTMEFDGAGKCVAGCQSPPATLSEIMAAIDRLAVSPSGRASPAARCRAARSSDRAAWGRSSRRRARCRQNKSVARA